MHTNFQEKRPRFLEINNPFYGATFSLSRSIVESLLWVLGTAGGGCGFCLPPPPPPGPVVAKVTPSWPFPDSMCCSWWTWSLLCLRRPDNWITSWIMRTKIITSIFWPKYIGLNNYFADIIMIWHDIVHVWIEAWIYKEVIILFLCALWYSLYRYKVACSGP